MDSSFLAYGTLFSCAMLYNEKFIKKLQKNLFPQINLYNLYMFILG